MEDSVLVSLDEGILTLTLNSAPRNGLSQAVLTRFSEVQARFHDPEVKAVIITGAGRHFSAGADVSEMPSIPSKQFLEAYAARAGALFNALAAMDKPVIAAINGTCLGGGLELALCCHFRVAADKALIGLPEIELGLMPGLGGTQRLPRLIGESRAMEMILFGKMIQGDEAFALGIVHKVVGRKEVLESAQEMARSLMGRDPIAVSRALRAVRLAATTPLEAGLELERTWFAELWERRFKGPGAS